MNSVPEQMIDIGRIAGTHGLRGDLKVRLNSGDPDLLNEIDRVSLRLPDGTVVGLDIIRRAVHKGQVLLRFKGYESINLVEHMMRSQVFIDEDALPELGNDEFYWKQLDGLKVFEQQHGEIGTLKDMYTTAAHDTWVVQGRYGEVLIPVVKEFIHEIDIAAGTIRVALPQGLIAEDDL